MQPWQPCGHEYVRSMKSKLQPHPEYSSIRISLYVVFIQDIRENTISGFFNFFYDGPDRHEKTRHDVAAEHASFGPLSIMLVSVENTNLHNKETRTFNLQSNWLRGYLLSHRGDRMLETNRRQQAPRTHATIDSGCTF